MVGYLAKRIIFLALFLGMIIVTPFAAWIGAILYVLFLGFSLIKRSGDSSVSPAGTVLLFICGFWMISNGLGFLNDLSLNQAFMEFLIVALCAVALIIGGYFFRRFVYEERANYYMDEKVEKLTRYYPTLLIISGALRIIIEAVRSFFSEALMDFIQYLDIGVTIGIILFVVAIVMYIVRMIHVFQQNR